jgi:hypothetical protein
MTTKKTLANQIIRLIQQYDIDRTITYAYGDILSFMDSVTNELARASFFENWKSDNKSIDSQFTVFFRNIPVYIDNSRNEAYSLMPAKYVSLPEGAGVDFIGTDKEQYVPVPRNFKALYKNNAAYSLLGDTGYYIDNDQDLKVFYTKNLVQAGAFSVNMRLVIADSSVIDEDAIYPIPAEYEQTLINRVLALFIPSNTQTKAQVEKDEQ